MIEARGLQHHFTIGKRGRERQVPVLRDIDLTIEQGEIVAIVGRSGSGKSTLLHILSGYLRPTAADALRVQGQDVSGFGEGEWARFRLERYGFMFQSFQLIPSMTAFENIELPLTLKGVAPARRRARTFELMERFGIADNAGHYPGELSGGQQQRVSVARALALEPPLVMADEPTGSLDSANEANLLGLIRELNRERGTTFVLITHDEQVARIAHRRLLLQDGRLQPQGKEAPYIHEVY